jgi:hypothetical protein
VKEWEGKQVWEVRHVLGRRSHGREKSRWHYEVAAAGTLLDRGRRKQGWLLWRKWAAVEEMGRNSQWNRKILTNFDTADLSSNQNVSNLSKQNFELDSK